MQDQREQIIPIQIEEEMRASFLDYAHERHRQSRAAGMFATASSPCIAAFFTRCMPAAIARTGRSTNAPRSSARSWASITPHGDSAIYDTLVRMAQDWNMRAALIDSPRQLRLRGRRSRRGHALHRVPSRFHRRTDDRGHREGYGRFCSELRRQGNGASRSAFGVPQPSREWFGRHRRGHGDEYPAPTTWAKPLTRWRI